MTPSLNYLKQWSGSHRGIRFKVTHWGISESKPQGTWCYYLYVPLFCLSERERNVWLETPAIRSQRHGRPPVMFRPSNNLPDIELHGGCTYYVVHEEDGNPPVGEIGCDYGHIWDEGYYYDEEMLARDAMHSIDELWNCYPDMKCICHWCGGVYAAGDCKESGDGYKCKTCEEKWPAKAEKKP